MKSNISYRVTAILVTVLLVTSVGVSPVEGAATQAQDATEITSCSTITDPGRYVLTQDIENSDANVCIDILSSDVRFDGGGHTIEGTITREQFFEILRANPEERPSRHVGIGVNVNTTGTLSNVTITNVTTTNWLFGVLSEGILGSEVLGVTSRANGGGIWLDGANASVIAGSNSSSNYLTGISIGAGGPAGHANYIGIADTTANGNTQTGIQLAAASDSRVLNVTATGNDLGFVVFGPPNATVRNVQVTASDFSRNGYHGMVVTHVTNATIANVSVEGTQGTFSAELFPENETPRVPASGIYAAHTSGNVFTDIDARNQAAWAYLAVANATNTVRNLTTDASVVSFEGRDIALGPTATAPVNASADPNATAVGAGLTVVNTSAESFIEMQVAWRVGDRQTRTGPPTEQVAAVVIEEPLIIQVGPPTDPDTDGRYEDVNGDRQLTVHDVAALTIIELASQQGVLQLSNRQVAAFDFNEDGQFDARDIVVLATEIPATNSP